LNSYWSKINDNEKLKFNEEMLEIYVEIIQKSLFEEFGSKWELFTEMTKEDKKNELED